jgi:transcriptional regulator with GAF, ATPase, and Fis domain
MSDVETRIENETNSESNQTGTVPEATVQFTLQPSEPSLRFSRDEAEIRAISHALHQTGWNRKRAARLLSISYRGLLYKIRRHNIAPPVKNS